LYGCVWQPRLNEYVVLCYVPVLSLIHSHEYDRKFFGTNLRTNDYYWRICSQVLRCTILPVIEKKMLVCIFQHLVSGTYECRMLPIIDTEVLDKFCIILSSYYNCKFMQNIPDILAYGAASVNGRYPGLMLYDSETCVMWYSSSVVLRPNDNDSFQLSKNCNTMVCLVLLQSPLTNVLFASTGTSATASVTVSLVS